MYCTRASFIVIGFRISVYFFHAYA
jgi:hypothetical protein